MKKKIICFTLVCSVITMTASNITFAAGEKHDIVSASSVSGYVKTIYENGAVTIADENKTPVIYVDEDDFEGVTRAVGDLAADITSVSDKAPTVVNSLLVEDSDIGITIGENTTSMKIEKSVDRDSYGIIATYNLDGTLATILNSTNNLSAGSDENVFTFSSTVSLENGKTIKGFVWSADGKQTPQTDVVRLVGKTYSGADIVVGTIGKSDVIDSLINSGKLNADSINGKNESFTIQSIDNTVVIAGSDKRGTIYGIYDLSEKMGVSPWQWWADVTPTKEDEIYVSLPIGGYTEGEPSVKYRGIFLNDEYNLNRWSESLEGSGKYMNPTMYEKVFELLLRLKANYLWPGMHEYSPSFHSYEENAKNADLYGIVMGTSHCDMLLRHNVGEWDAYAVAWAASHPEAKLLMSGSVPAYDYTWKDKYDNDDLVLDYWRDRVKEVKNYENTYTVGMRGVHDGTWGPSEASSTAEKVKMLEEIISKQRQILSEEIGKPAEEIPQVFIPYKEIQPIYNAGMNVPDDVTIMWTDDNFGYIRQMPTDAERQRAGGSGIYYHISYYGRPISYLWLSTTQLGLIRQEFTKAYDMDSKQVWVVNVGDIKPGETTIEYTMKLAKDVDKMRDVDIDDYLAQNAKRDFAFTKEQANEYAYIQNEYYRLSNSRRPEHMAQNLFSLTNFGDEAQKLLDTYKDLVERSTALYNSLPEDKKPAFFELQLYPLRSVYNLTLDYISASRANTYYEQGKGAIANKYSKMSINAVEDIAKDTLEYNSMLGGKWNKIMNLTPEKLKSTGGNVTTALTVPNVSRLPYTNMEIGVDGQEDILTEPSLSFSNYDTENKFIDIYNTGYDSFKWTLESDVSYIEFNKTTDIVYDSDRIYAGVDYDNAPKGKSTGNIIVKSYAGDTVISEKQIAISINNSEVVLKDNAYMETDGIVSIEAEHYSNSVKNGEYEWKVEKDFGRSGDSVKIYPNLASRVSTPNSSNSAYLEYEVYFENTGEYTFDVYRMPTLNEIGTMKFAVGIDDNNPVVLTGQNAYVNNSSGSDNWGKGVLANTQVLTTKVNVTSEGYHKIRLYNQDSGIVIDKMVLTKGDVKPSYYGAPESYNSTYNNKTPVMPEAGVPTEAVGSFTKLFEPSFVVSKVNNDSVDVVKVAEYNKNAVVALVNYDKDGNMLEMKYDIVDFSGNEINDKITVNLSLSNSDAKAKTSVIVFDDFENANVLCPIYDIGSVDEPSGDSLVKVKADLTDYKGKQSMIIISDYSEDTTTIPTESIRYIKQEIVTSDSYKFIPFANVEKGKFNVKIGVSGKNPISEVLNTIVNILPDTEEQSENLYNWTFDTTGDIGSAGQYNIPVLSGSAAYYETDKLIKLSDTSTGGANVTFEEPIVVMQGQQLTVKFDIFYGKLIKQYTDYAIKDGAGNTLVSSHISVYDPSANAPTIYIGDTNVVTDVSALSNAISRGNNLALANGPTTFTNVFDFETNRATVTVSSSKGEITYTAKLTDESVASIKAIDFSTTYNNTERACYLDNISLDATTAAQYKININPMDNDKSIENAVVKVVDAKCDVEILPKEDGSYMLCEGLYNCIVSADGYRDVERILDISPALESKQINITMKSVQDVEPATVKVEFVDENGAAVFETINIDGLYEDGSYAVPSNYLRTQSIKNDNSKYDVYTYNEKLSTVSIESLNAGENILKVVYNSVGEYYLYEEYTDYVVENWNGTTDAVKVVSEEDEKCLRYSSNGKTIGGYTTFDAVAGTGKYKISADLKFAPAGTAGNSQFTLGGSAPMFDGGNINYGVINNDRSTKHSGHIIAFEYNAGTAFKLNDQDISMNFVGEWFHMDAVIDFDTNTVKIVVTNENGEKADVETTFFSDATDLATYYMRAAKSNGTVSLDNLKISDYTE